jgi:pyruvate dehydrogenase E1 component alpha subunit
MTVVAEFRIECRRILGADGRIVGTLPEFAKDRSTLARLYYSMILTRTFDEKAIALQRTGRLGTYASSLGQEAVNVGLAHAMTEADVLLPSFREHGAQLFRGVTAKELFLYWGGDERGSAFGGPRDDFPVSIPVASHSTHAAGAALAFRLRGEPRVAVAVFGDGATSKGDVYEAMNVAGAWTLPVVFVVINNEWAISVPRRAQTAAQTLAQKAVAAGFEGVQVDGNDVIAVRETVARALGKARAGGGPTLVEALTYRLGDHTTVDDASRYRDDDEVARHWKDEPVARLRQHLSSAHGWSKDEEEALIESCQAEIANAAEAYLAEPPDAPTAMFDCLHARLPRALAAQRDALAHEARS